MNTGIMEQVGTPFEIYNFPTTVFSANFVGSLNNSSAEVVDPSNGTIAVDGVQFESAVDLKQRKKAIRFVLPFARNV